MVGLTGLTRSFKPACAHRLTLSNAGADRFLPVIVRQRSGCGSPCTEFALSPMKALPAAGPKNWELGETKRGLETGIGLAALVWVIV